MNLLDLPIEVGLLLFRYLDSKTRIIAYSVIELRYYFAPCHVKYLSLSRSSLASVKSFSLDLFQDFAEHIQELNLSAIPDLNAVNLKPHIQRCCTLKYLDVTFTDIYLSDIHEICPKTLTRISINFFKKPRECFRGVIWNQCQNIFRTQAFESVHFIVFELLDSDTPLNFTQDIPKLKYLKITVADKYKEMEDIEYEDSSVDIGDPIDINFDKLSYVFRDCRVTHRYSITLKGVSNLNFRQLEYIFIMCLETIYICVSPVFSSIFALNCTDLKIEISPCLPLDFMLDGNIIFKAWNKSATEFNEAFFEKLLDELKDYFPSFICMQNKEKMIVTQAQSDWYCLDSCYGCGRIENCFPKKLTLTDFCRKDGVVTRSNRPILISLDSKTLNNITFLRLSDIFCKANFFKIIFTECQLHTLDFHIEKHRRKRRNINIASYLEDSIHLAKSLKNIKLTSEDFYYDILFNCLSRCPSLENIHICEFERNLDDAIDEGNMSLVIENCHDLYSLFIEADMPPESLTMLMAPLRDVAQRLERDHLCIEVCEFYTGWNPFVDVFSPSPLNLCY